MSSGPVDFPKPIEIVIPAGTGDADAIAFLLATIGRPPASADDQGWRQTISAYRRANLEDRATSAVNRPEGAPTGLLIRPEDLLIGDQLRASRLEHARLRVERALFATAITLPHVIRAMQGITDRPLEELPRQMRSPETRQAVIERMLLGEDDVAELRERAAIPPAPPRLGALGFASQMTPKNIRTRILRPAEPVLHLALGLKWMVDEVGGDLAKTYPNQEAWEREGLGTTPARQPDGGTVMRPRVTERYLFKTADLFGHALERADILLPLAEDYILDGRRSRLAPMVRLTRG